MSAEKITEVINAYFEAICRLDCEAWIATFATDAVSHEPGNPPLAGHDMLRAFFNGVAGGFDSIEMRPTHVFVVGNEAGVKWATTGVGKTGREAKFEGIDIFTFNDAGKIQTVRAYWDPAAMMAQLMS